jgi:hypothetical protein
MTTKLAILGIATVFAAASSVALAAGPNDGPKYPNAESHKTYVDHRNLDHNNAAPRYPVTSTGKQYKDVRNLDHNNPSPRYAVSTTQTKTGTAATRRAGTVMHASHRRAVPRVHG